MSRRTLYIDRAPGEVRGVVMLDDRPERLLIARRGDAPEQQLGARSVAQLRRIDRRLAGGFLDIGEGPEAMLPLSGAARALAEGAAVEVEVVAEPRSGKGAVVRLVGAADGPPRLIAPAPPVERRLAAFAPGASIVEGMEARDAADEAEAAALAVDHPLPGGGAIAIEPTRALVAIDVDLRAAGGDARQVALRTNLSAIAEAARLLRLKGLGGLVVIDLIGERHDGPAIASAAQAAFAADQPGVSIGPISRFGLLQLVLPRRARPLAERLLQGGRPSPETVALRLLRALERMGRADGGARLAGRCAPAAAEAAKVYMDELTDRIGPRFDIRAEPSFAHDQIDVSAL